MGPWLNVLDPGFDWHLNESGLSGGCVDPEAGSVILHMVGGGQAAKLSGCPMATAEQQVTWRNLLEKTVPA